MNSLVCVDANIVVRTFVYGPFSEEATALLTRWSRQGISLIAPSLFAFEVVSTLRRLVYLKEITPREGEEAFQHFLAFKIRLSHRKAVWSSAWQLAKQLNRPRAYDTAYLALAQLHRCDFWTADEKLYNAVREQLPWVKWVGNFASQENGQEGSRLR
jgi:predicted nucleic acid-binding protein